MRNELERICKNRETYATLAITTHLLEPITVHDNAHVIISFPDFGKPDADYALYEKKIIMTGLVTAHALARAAAQAPVVESVDFPALQRNVDDLGSTVKLRTQLKGDITRSLTSALKVETSFGLLDARLDEIMASFTTFLERRVKESRARIEARAAGHQLASAVPFLPAFFCLFHISTTVAPVDVDFFIDAHTSDRPGRWRFSVE